MKFQIKRLYFQLLALLAANLGAFGFKTGFCYPFFYCHSCPASASACPLRALEIGVFRGRLSWQLLAFPLLILGFFGVTTGRAVCGWACPIGLLQRATAPVARRLKHIPLFQLLGKHPIEPKLRYLKYLTLLGLVFGSPFLVGFMFTDICPVGVLTGTIPLLALNPGGFTPAYYFYPAFIIFILFMLLIFVVERGWCRYFCPVGAILAPFNKISYLHVEVDKDECIHCNVCSEVCPMGIDVPNMYRDPECILCGKCVTACPKSIISFRRA